MIHKLICYFRGYLRIRISGNAIERFINTCSYKGINLWNLSSNSTFYEMNIFVGDFRKLKPVIRKTKTKVLIVEKAGFPFFLQKYHKRKILFTGLILCVSIIYILSTYIWDISLGGNYTYTKDNLSEFLETINVRKGMKIKDVDCTYIAREIRQAYDDIIWVSASIEGTRLKIQIKENDGLTESDNIPDTTDPYDIISDGDYQITKIVIRNGISQIHEGDSVKKGDVLVSGQIPVYNDAKEITGYQYCLADADIFGKTKLTYKDEAERKTISKNFTEIEKQEYYLVFGKYRILLGGIKNNYEHFEEYSKNISIGEFSFGTRHIYPYFINETKYSDDELQQILSSNYHYYCKQLEKKGVVILENDVKIYTWSDKAKAIGTLTVEMPIGQKEKSEIKKTGDHIDGNDGNNN